MKTLGSKSENVKIVIQGEREELLCTLFSYENFKTMFPPLSLYLRDYYNSTAISGVDPSIVLRDIHSFWLVYKVQFVLQDT